MKSFGKHLLVELGGPAIALDDPAAIERAIIKGVSVAGGKLIEIHFHKFNPQGVTGIALLEESHVAFHSWPELGYAAMDVLMCGEANPFRCVDVICEELHCRKIGMKSVSRGMDTGDAHFVERLFPAAYQTLKVNEYAYSNRSKFQDIEIFDNRHFGRVLTLDNVVQVTEADEYIYHEMIAHVPVMSCFNPKHVLIIGGGDGGTLREVLKHKDIESVTVVDIDRMVVKAVREHMGFMGNPFTDPRAELFIGDGLDFVRKTTKQYDVIIVDSTDPDATSSNLYGGEFYQYCWNALTADGVLVNTNTAVFFDPVGLKNNLAELASVFYDVSCYLIAPPSLYGGHTALGFASKTGYALKRDPAFLKADFDAKEIPTRHYTPELHKAAFVLPKNIRALMPEVKA